MNQWTKNVSFGPHSQRLVNIIGCGPFSLGQAFILRDFVPDTSAHPGGAAGLVRP